MANQLLKPIETLVQRPVKCGCGRTHRTPLKTVAVERGVIRRLPEILDKYKEREILIVGDRNTMPAAGDEIVKILGFRGFHIGEYVFAHDLLPAETDIGPLMLAAPRSGLMLAVGSGALQDLVKYVAFQLSVPYVAVPTAASSDGMAHPYSVFFEKGGKRMRKAAPPVAIVADLDVIAAAPKPMATVGAAAVFAKYISLFDWRLSKIVDETPYCANLYEAFMAVLGDFSDSLSGSRPLYSVGTLEMLTRALIFSGIAVSFSESLAPVTGSETAIADCLFMTKGYNPFDVYSQQLLKAVASANCARVAESITKKKPDFEAAKSLLDGYGWAVYNAEVVRVYGEYAKEVLSRSDGYTKYNREMHRRRLYYTADRWGEIVAAAGETVPEYARFREMLRSCTLPYRFDDIGMTRDQALDAVLWSGELSERFDLLTLIWTVGEIDSVAYALTARMRDV